MDMILKERVWLTHDGRPVREGHYEARLLLGAVGASIPEARAVELGLVDGMIQAGKENPMKAIHQPVSDKTLHKPVVNKAQVTAVKKPESKPPQTIQFGGQRKE